MPTLYVVAGPNGCGKSTLTRTTWFSEVEVIDPDAISRGIPPDETGQAAREALLRRKGALRATRDHLVETTLAGHGILHHMEAARTAGHRIMLHYICVDTPERALDRIRSRVAHGGHDVPESDVRRRFFRSLAKLPAAIAQSDEVIVYDNSSLDHPHREVAILRNGAWWIASRVPGWTTAALARAASSKS